MSTNQVNFGARRFGRVNWLGLWTLIRRENLRYLAVWQQTILAPLVTAGLFLLIFSIAVGPGRGDVFGYPYLEFLAPGLVMMTVIQNAFANTSSSLLSAKVMGNIVDTLMPPLSPLELTIGYLAGGVGRSLMIAIVMYTGMFITFGTLPAHPMIALMFVLFGSMFMGGLGLMGALYARKFDQMAAISNFVITPLAFLSGTFYSIAALPEVLQNLTRYNPMFYIIDGGRYGVLGASDGAVHIALSVAGGAGIVMMIVVWVVFRKGLGLKP